MIWFKMIRPATLPAALVPVGIGLLLAAQTAELSCGVALATILTATTIQILSNLVNDYYDYKKGADGSERLGPVRAISAGLVTERYLKSNIFIMLFLALAGGCYLIFVGGWPIILIGVSAILFAWLYSATSYSLSSLGIADIFVLIYFGPVATAGTCFLQTGSWSLPAIWYGLGAGVISMAVLTVNNVRDMQQDRKHGKRTLVVRLGMQFAHYYYLLLLLLPTLPLLFLPNTLWLLLYLSAALLLFYRFTKASGRGYNAILGYTSLLNLLYGLTIFLGYYC